MFSSTNESLKEEYEDIQINLAQEEIAKHEEIIPAAPEEGADSGLADVINKLIIDEWEAISGYNSAVIMAQTEGKEDIADILTSIGNEEHVHVGELEKALSLVSPQAQSIKDGEQEAVGIIQE